jgi:hypothetical protein
MIYSNLNFPIKIFNTFSIFRFFIVTHVFLQQDVLKLSKKMFSLFQQVLHVAHICLIIGKEMKKRRLYAYTTINF